MSPEQIDTISNYLDDWENVSFEDKQQVRDLMITIIRATSKKLQIEWKSDGGHTVRPLSFYALVRCSSLTVPHYPRGKRGRPPIEMGINFFEQDVPNDATLLHFRHLLEDKGIGKLFFDAINRIRLPRRAAPYPPPRVFAPFWRDGVWKTRNLPSCLFLYFTFAITFDCLLEFLMLYSVLPSIHAPARGATGLRSEEHTSDLQSLITIAVGGWGV